MIRRKDDDHSASRFKQYVRLERPVTSQDSLGDTLTTWVLEDEVWGDIHPVSGLEEYRHQSLREVITHRVHLRYRSDVKPDWRLVYQGREMQIHAVVNLEEEGKLLKLWVEELG